MSEPVPTLTLSADVLVIGGGPAGCWAALTARAAGASVVLAEKGFVGTSGATAPSNTTLFYNVPGDAEQNAAMVGDRIRAANGFVVPGFVHRVFDEAAAKSEIMARWGYDWPRNELGKSFRGNLRGPDYMMFLRKRLLAEGVRILDHSPVLELLSAGGVAAGAAGIDRRSGDRWAVRAGAVVMATGGCAFRSGVVGTHNLTGDGYLFAAEAGAEFSGMEFSGHYSLAPAEGGLTKGIIYFSGSFSTEDGSPVGRDAVATTLMSGRPVYAVLDKADAYLEEGYRRGQPNIFVYFHRLGGNPFTERYPVKLLCEGTVRTVGGLVVDERCATNVPGLFAVGDVTGREKLTGTAMSGGGPAAAWCIASGTWAGRAAGRFAAALGPRQDTRSLSALGRAGLRPAGGASDRDLTQEITRGVQAEMLPLDKNYLRTGDGLTASLAVLDRLWSEARDRLAPGTGGNPRDVVRAREAAALVATARWVYRSALARTESRGLHQRADFPSTDPAQHHHLITGGLDEVYVRRADPAGEAVAA